MSLPLDVKPEITIEQSSKDREIVSALVDYKREAEHNRKAGLNPRDDKWRQNLDLYWNRHDFTNKADWQSKNVMPEVPSYVDRFAAALKEALVTSPNGFYTVEDPYDTENDLAQSIKNVVDVWLSVCGRNQVGTPIDFGATFEDQIKMGALMNMSARVLWKDDIPGGRVAIETHDPRFVWLDHTYRGLYRICRNEVDMADIARMVGMVDGKGQPLYKLDEVQRLVASRSADAMQKKELSGQSEEITSGRQPIVLDEYLASVVGQNGELLMDRQVAIVADDTYLIRGPEKNPFWHGQDWLVYTPLIPVPLSPYGRSYMEDFGSIAKVFTDLTNLILDATYMSAMKAYVLVPSMLRDPSQATSGVWPNKTFMLDDGYSAEDFAKAIELGSLDSGAVTIWEKLKAELGDAAGMNEIGLGQLPSKTHIAATAVAGAQQSSSAMLRSIAQTVETRFLDPMLNLVWKTGMQHVRQGDQRMMAAVGPEMWAAMMSRRKEFISQPITFQARGISGLIQKQQRLQAMLQVMQVIAQDQNLMAAFMQRVDMNKLINLLFNLSNVDLSKIEVSQRQAMIQSVAGSMPQPTGGTPSPAGLKQMGDVATRMGVAS